MKSRLTLIIIAIVMGLLAAIGIFSYVNGLASKYEAEGKKIMVVIATADVPFGTRVEDMRENGRVALREVPAKYVAAGALTNLDGQEGRVLITKLSKGEQLTAQKLEMPNKAGLKYKVPKGHRAITIPVTEVTGVAGMIIPGAYVDVVVSFKPGPNDKNIAKIMLHNVMILAVGKSLDTEEQKVQEDKKSEESPDKVAPKAEDKPSSNVTMALTPPDVEKLVFAAENGGIWLTLAPSNREVVPTPGQTMETVLQ